MIVTRDRLYTTPDSEYTVFMRSRYKIVESDGIYFLTATIIEWIPTLTGTDVCDDIVASLGYCRQHKALRLYAYVILDNLMHLVAEAPDLIGVVRSFKAYTAKAILHSAQRQGKEWLLNQFTYYKKRHKDASQYQVWQEGVHPQLIEGDIMLRQKIDYVHENPVRRGYVDAPEHWRYSSARNYVGGGLAVMDVDLLPF